MPSIETVERFIAMVENGDNIAAMECFYSPDATMQENEHPPRKGLPELLTFERAALASVRSLRAQCVRPVFVSGDQAVIRWVFDSELPDGQTTRLDELSLQRWQGEFIVEEKFFYDPKQLKPVKTG